MYRQETVVNFDPKTFAEGSIVTYCFMELEDKYPPVNREQIEGKHMNGLVHSYKPSEINLILSSGRFQDIQLSRVVNGPKYDERGAGLPIKIIAVSKQLEEEN
jgi:hypothetical protein